MDIEQFEEQWDDLVDQIQLALAESGLITPFVQGRAQDILDESFQDLRDLLEEAVVVEED